MRLLGKTQKPDAQHQPARQATALQTVVFPGVRGRVILEDAPEVLAGLRTVLSAWEPDVSGFDPRNCDDPLSVVSYREGLFDLHSSYLEEPLNALPVASAVCGVIADIGQAFFEERPGCIALHCGAARIKGRLIAMTGEARAGKSTLMSRLTAESDMQVYCDDILPVLSDGLAYGLGIAPRLRLPLPPRASSKFRAHVAAHTGLADDKYAYVTAPTVAPHGTRAPLSAIVLLSRQDDGPARLHHLPAVEAVRHLMSQNMADSGDGRLSFDRMTDLAQNLPCMRLIYADLEDAVALLRMAFGGDDAVSTDVTLHPALPEAFEQAGPAMPADPARLWMRAANVAVRHLGEESFLWQIENRGFFHLNLTAGAIWALLDEAMTGAAISETLIAVFPDIPQDRIRKDVSLLLGALHTEGLIVAA